MGVTIRPPSERDLDQDQRRRILVSACLAGAALHLATLGIQTFLQRGVPAGLVAGLAFDLLLASAGMLVRLTRSLETSAFVLGAGAAVLVPLMAAQTGGIGSPAVLAIPMIPLLLGGILRRRMLFVLGGLVVASLVTVAVAQGLGLLAPSPYTPAQALIMNAFAACGCVLAATVAAWFADRDRSEARQALLRIADELREASTHDALTGLYNQRHLFERLVAEEAFARRHQLPLSVVMVDVDHFKHVNDAHGHAAGDAVLVELAARILASTRVEDVVARVGGEEILIVLRGTDRQGAARAAERVREKIAGRPVTIGALALSVTVSAGCAAFDECDPPTVDRLRAIADERLYEAKRAGRNRVSAGEPQANAK